MMIKRTAIVKILQTKISADLDANLSAISGVWPTEPLKPYATGSPSSQECPFGSDGFVALYNDGDNFKPNFLRFRIAQCIETKIFLYFWGHFSMDWESACQDLSEKI